jgi:hypothetical protein
VSISSHLDLISCAAAFPTLTSAEKDKILNQIIKISEELEKENNLFKQTVKISDEENEIISRIIDTTTEDIHHVLKKPKSSTPKLDTVINQALTGDTWFTPPKFIDNNHPVDLIPAKALPSSSNVKLLNPYTKNCMWTLSSILSIKKYEQQKDLLKKRVKPLQ